MVFLFAIGTFASTLLGGLFILKYKDRLHRILGFAVGVLLGAVFFDLLPEAIHLAGPERLIQITSSVVIGFLVFHLLQRLLFLHPCPEEQHDEHHENTTHQHMAGLEAGTFIIHSFFDGLAIGVAFQLSQAAALIVALAVMAHDFSDGLNTVSILLRHKMKEKKIILWLLMDALAPLLGIAVAQAITIPPLFLAFLLALFSGFFLYIATADLLPETHHEHSQWQTVTATVAGAAFMFVVSRLLLG